LLRAAALNPFIPAAPVHPAERIARNGRFLFCSHAGIATLFNTAVIISVDGGLQFCNDRIRWHQIHGKTPNLFFTWKGFMEFQFTEGRVFSVDEKQEVIAEATYHSIGQNAVDIDHTYVNPAYRGQGVAGKLMQAVAAYLRKNGLKAAASCSYASAWFQKNRETCGDIIWETDER